MSSYYIEVCRESCPMVRELSNQEHELILSILDESQSGIIEEYPFNHDDVVSVAKELSEKRTRIQRQNFLWVELYKRYPQVRNEIMRYFISEVEAYNSFTNSK